MRIIGLTGGIASGKSTVGKILEREGVTVVDADQLARQVVVPGKPAYDAIVSAFGEIILNPDGTINRSALGAIVFADAGKRRVLEAIVHPVIQAQAAETIAALERSGEQRIVYMAPLLLEADITSDLEALWVVYVDEETQASRLIARDGLDREAALQRISTQMPMEEKVKYGTVIIDNRGTVDETECQVRCAWQKAVEARVEKSR